MLVISGFSLCAFEWLGYVDDNPHLQSYDSGRVCSGRARPQVRAHEVNHPGDADTPSVRAAGGPRPACYPYITCSVTRPSDGDHGTAQLEGATDGTPRGA
jgi:hypothetical protein